jgi:hypothetical protein
VGHKRGREEEQAIPFKPLIDRLMMLGESPDPTERADAAAVARSVERAARQLRQDSASSAASTDPNTDLSALLEVLVDAASSLPQKAPLLALTVGLAAAGDEAAAAVGGAGGGDAPAAGGGDEAVRTAASRLVSRAAAALEAALAVEHGGGRLDARCYARFLACLAPAGVVTPRSLARLLSSLVAAARDAARGDLGRGDPRGHTWQPWADELVALVVTEALPYCGGALAAGAPQDLDALRDELDGYVFGSGGGGEGGGEGGEGGADASAAASANGSRPLSFDPEMRPFGVGVPASAAAADAARVVAAGGLAVTGDPTLGSDSGAATALAAAWRAVRECGWPSAAAADDAAPSTREPWSIDSVPAIDPRTEERLAQSPLSPEEIPLISLPPGPPGVARAAAAVAALAAAADDAGTGAPSAEPHPSAAYACLAAAVRAAYPPPGMLRFLPSEKTDVGRPAAERVVADALVASAAATLAQNRVEAAAALVRGLPLPYAHDGVLAEALLGSQVMCLPRCPDREPGAAGALLMDVCRLSSQFPRYLAAAAREAYSRASRLDPTAEAALASYLAHHISSFGWVWFWDRWGAAARGHPRSARARFCAAIVRRLLRLSYRDHVSKKLPEAFLPMLGPVQEPVGVPVGVPYDPHALAEDEEREEPRPMEEEEQDAAAAAAAAAATPEEREEARWAGKLMGVLRYRRTDTGAPTPLSADEVAEWLRRPGGLFESVAGGGGGGQRGAADMGAAAAGGGGGPTPRALRVVARALLALGAKTPTHTAAALERMAPALAPLFREHRGRPALEAACALWRRSPQRLSLTVERLVDAGYARARDVPAWLAQGWDGLARDPPAVPPAAAPPAAEPAEGAAATDEEDASARAAREAALDASREHLMLEEAAHELIHEATARAEAEADAAEADERQLADEAGAAESAVARAEAAASASAAAAATSGPTTIDFSARDLSAARLRLEEVLRRRERALEAAAGARAELAATARASLLALARWAARAAVEAGSGGGAAAMADDDAPEEEREEPPFPRRCAHVRAYARRFAPAAAASAAELAAEAQGWPREVREAALGPLRLLE